MNKRSRRNIVALAAGLACIVAGAVAAPSYGDDDPGAYGNEDPAALDAAVVATAAGASDRGVTVQVTRGPSGIEVEGRCRIEASRAAAWEVLTDYEGIDHFVSSMSESRITERGKDHVLVEQVAIGRLFFFSRKLRVVLRVREEPPGYIQFEDVLHRDFTTYRGDWHIVDRGRDVEIVYRVNADPAFNIPDVVARGVFRRTVRDLVFEVGAEIVRREALAAR